MVYVIKIVEVAKINKGGSVYLVYVNVGVVWVLHWSVSMYVTLIPVFVAVGIYLINVQSIRMIVDCVSVVVQMRASTGWRVLMVGGRQIRMVIAVRVNMHRSAVKMPILVEHAIGVFVNMVVEVVVVVAMLRRSHGLLPFIGEARILSTPVVYEGRSSVTLAPCILHQLYDCV